MPECCSQVLAKLGQGFAERVGLRFRPGLRDLGGPVGLIGQVQRRFRFGQLVLELGRSGLRGSHPCFGRSLGSPGLLGGLGGGLGGGESFGFTVSGGRYLFLGGLARLLFCGGPRRRPDDLERIPEVGLRR